MSGLRPLSNDRIQNTPYSKIDWPIDIADLKFRVEYLESIVLKDRQQSYLKEGQLVYGADGHWKHPLNDKLWTQEEVDQNNLDGFLYYGEDGKVYKDIPV